MEYTTEYPSKDLGSNPGKKRDRISNPASSHEAFLR